MKSELISCILQVAGLIASVSAFAMSLYALLTYKAIKKQVNNEKEKGNASL